MEMRGQMVGVRKAHPVAKWWVSAKLTPRPDDPWVSAIRPPRFGPQLRAVRSRPAPGGAMTMILPPARRVPLKRWVSANFPEKVGVRKFLP